jgi:hypothetical protein
VSNGGADVLINGGSNDTVQNNVLDTSNAVAYFYLSLNQGGPMTGNSLTNNIADATGGRAQDAGLVLTHLKTPAHFQRAQLAAEPDGLGPAGDTSRF